MSHHTWKMIVIAAGPGVFVSAALGVYEFSDRHSLRADLLGAYPVALLAFLPALPVLAMTLVRAFPPREWSLDGNRVRPLWLVLSWFAPWWHVGAARVAMWSLHVPLHVNWGLVFRHSACLWFVTACGWICTSRRPQLRREASFSTGEVKLPSRDSASPVILATPMAALPVASGRTGA